MVNLNPLHYINEINEAIGHSTADVLEFIGITNPAVDPDGIREVARQWEVYGDALDAASWQAGLALNGLQWQGKAAGAFHSRTKHVRDAASQAAGVLHQGHHQLNAFADEAHELISQIGVLCAQILEFEVAALPLTFLTGPLSEVASNLAAGERAAKIIALIARIAEALKTVDRIIDAVIEALGALGRALRALEPLAKMAAGGIAMTLGYDAIAAPDRLRHADSLEQDIEVGALLGMIGGGFGKGVQGLLRGLGPGLIPALAGTVAAGEGDAPESVFSRLGVLMRDKDWWDKLPQETKDLIRGRWDAGNAFNRANEPRYQYSEVRLEPPAGSKLNWVQVDSYNPGKEIVSRKFSQLADLSPDTVKSEIAEIPYKYSPGTKIISQKGDLYGTRLSGNMILEVPVQDAPVPADIIRYAAQRKVTIRDIDGHVYTLKNPGGGT